MCLWHESKNKTPQAGIQHGSRGVSKGHTDLCQRLHCGHGDGPTVGHDSEQTVLPVRASGHSDRVAAAVFLERPAGTESFHTVSPDSLTHTPVHFHTHTFTEPLCAGFTVWSRSSVRLREQRQSLCVRVTSGHHGYSTCLSECRLSWLPLLPGYLETR